MKYQIDRFAEDSYIDFSTFKNFSYPLHFHRAIELIYLTEGELTVLQPGKKTHLKAGESVLFLSNELHGYESIGESTYDCLVFSPNWIHPFLKKTQGVSPVMHKFNLDNFEVNYFKSINSFLNNSLKIQGLLLMICSSFHEQVEWVDTLEQTNNDLTTRIIDYIGRHYLENLTLKQVASDLGYDHFYLSHFVSKNLGTSFHQYVTKLRLSHALDLLQTTDNKISDIAFQAGFSSVRTFNTHFKKEFKKTPKEFLK